MNPWLWLAAGVGGWALGRLIEWAARPRPVGRPVLGLRGVPGVEGPTNWREGILFAHPDAATLTAFMAKVDAEAETDPAFAWFEEQVP